MPSDVYRDALNFSIIISTNCTNAAIVAINITKCKKLRSTSSVPEIPVQVNAPSFSK